MELKIAFTEKPANTGAFVFDLSLDGENHCRDTAFINPLAEKDLKDLRWYLEEYLDWPFNPIIRSRGEEIEAKLDDWGAALFRSLFAGPEARVLYNNLVEGKDGERFLTLQSPDARVLRLPWELIRDKAGPLITAGVSIRRHVEQPVTPTVPQFTLPLNVLYVIARPLVRAAASGAHPARSSCRGAARFWRRRQNRAGPRGRVVADAHRHVPRRRAPAFCGWPAAGRIFAA
jgi:hypothetical protein